MGTGGGTKRPDRLVGVLKIIVGKCVSNFLFANISGLKTNKEKQIWQLFKILKLGPCKP